MKTLDEVKELFAKDRFATDNGAVIENFGDGYAKCSLQITDRHRNAAGALMGGVPFVLADFAFAVAENHGQMATVSLASTITYLGVPRGACLIAEAKRIKGGRSTCYYRVVLTDELDTPVAEVVVNGFRKQDPA